MTRNEISAQRLIDMAVQSILESGTEANLDGSMFDEVRDLVNHENTQEESAWSMAVSCYRPGARLLDFGCGTGVAQHALEQMGYEWWGINYKDGMASYVRDAADDNPKIFSYNGIDIPFSDRHFEVVYSTFVFEHLQNIDSSFSEIARVLKPGGKLIGTVSYLEQMHDYSTFNFTPLGLKLTAARSGLTLRRVFPTYDVFSWMLHRLLAMTGNEPNSAAPRQHHCNVVDQAIIAYGHRLGLPYERINLFRLTFSTHVGFLIEKTQT